MSLDVVVAAAAQLTTRRMWAAVVVLASDQLVAWGVLYYAYAVLSAPIARDLDVSMRVVAGAFSLTLAVSAVLARPVGRWLDRAGTRSVLLTGALLAPLACAAIAGVRGPVTLFLAFAGLGLAQATALYEPAFRAIVEWCPREGDRARALVVLTSIAGFASTLVLPLTAGLVEKVGWRGTALVLAVIAGAVMIPARAALPVRQFARPRVEPTGDRRPRTSASGDHATTVLTVAFALQSFAATGATVCLVWHLVDAGRSVQTAALLAGLAGASQVPGRLVLAPIQRALRMDRRVALLLVVQALALASIAAGWTPGLLVGVMLFGASSGMTTLERATVTLEWWGRDDFGARSGRIASVALLSRAAAPYGVEVMHTVASYAMVLVTLAICMFGAAIVFGHAHRVRARRVCVHPTRRASPTAMKVNT